jgi:hypothetical protein
MTATAPASPQAVLGRGDIPELAGPLDEQPDGSCVPAAPDTRERDRTMPASSHLMEQQARKAIAEKARKDAIDERVREVVADEMRRIGATQ